MTALCGGGPSQQKPGFDPVQIIIGGAIGEAISGLGMGWVAETLVAAAVVEYSLNTLCSTDPPPAPTIDQVRMQLYHDNSAPGAYAAIVQDATQLLAHYLWSHWCECVTGTQPTTPPPLAPPSTVTINDPTTAQPGDQSCGVGPFWFQTAGFDSSGNMLLTPNSSPSIPSALKWVSWTLNGGVTNPPANPYPVTITLQASNASGQPVFSNVFSMTADIPNTSKQFFSAPCPPTATQWTVLAHSDTPSGVNYGPEIHTTFYCTPIPNTSLQPCCPPDPTIENLVLQVLRLEQLILSQTGGSIAYTKGTVHTALTGSASLTVAGLRGVLIDITAGSPTKPPLIGNPSYLWDMGWISMMDGDGMIEEKRLTRQHQVWTPRLAPNASIVGYYLNPGVVVNITELLPA